MDVSVCVCVCVCVCACKRHCVLEQAYCCSWNIIRSPLSNSSCSLLRAHTHTHTHKCSHQPPHYHQPILPLFSHFSHLSRRWGKREMEDGGERGPLKRLAFLQDSVNQSGTHTRSLSLCLFFLLLHMEQRWRVKEPDTVGDRTVIRLCMFHVKLGYKQKASNLLL